MTDYRTLSDWEKAKVDQMILEEVEPGLFTNPHNRFKWSEPELTMSEVHGGERCATCLMLYYNCVCSHGG